MSQTTLALTYMVGWIPLKAKVPIFSVLQDNGGLKSQTGLGESCLATHWMNGLGQVTSSL